jgi:hypothetical protein
MFEYQTVKRDKAKNKWKLRAIITINVRERRFIYLSSIILTFLHIFITFCLSTHTHTHTHTPHTHTHIYIYIYIYVSIYIYLYKHTNLQSGNIIKCLYKNCKNIKERRHFLYCLGHTIKSIYVLPNLISTCFCVFLGYATLGDSKE